MQLKDKLTNKEDVVRAISNTFSTSYERYASALVSETGITPSWWAVRELARIGNKVYELTDALVAVNKHAKVFAHVSLVDRTKVAFTPDKAFGERDAQLTMNFGKMVQRVIPFASDEYVKRLTEDHNADLSDEVEWVTGPEIANIYATTSVGSCMAGKTWKGVNPILAYDAPGIKMAVLRDSDGMINARCMVYEDGEDKRLIRNYGDERLRKRLKRLGYVEGGWKGVKFRTIKTYSQEFSKYKVTIPYLDCLNGPAKAEHCSLILMDGVLQVAKDTANLARKGIESTIPSTDGYVWLKDLKSADYAKVDAITGEAINTLTEDTVNVFINGVEGIAKKSSITEDYINARKFFNGSYRQLFMLRTETFVSNYGYYFEGEEERKGAGFFKLSSKFYDTEGWQSGYSIATVDVDGENHTIKREDSVRLFSEGLRLIVHKSQITKAHTRVADCDGEKWYVTSDVTVLRTPSKAKVVDGIHDIREGWNGWDYARNLKLKVDVFGETVYHRLADKNSDAFRQYLAQKVKVDVEAAFNVSGLSVQSSFCLLARNLPTRYYYPTEGSSRFTRSTYGVRQVHDMNLDTFKEFLKAFLNSYDKNDVQIKTLVSQAEIRIAELEATNGEEPAPALIQAPTPKLVIADRFAVAA